MGSEKMSDKDIETLCNEICFGCVAGDATKTKNTW
jgi:hypothetical protein